MDSNDISDIILPTRRDLDQATNDEVQFLACALADEGITEIDFDTVDETLANAGYAESNGAVTTLMIRCLLALGVKLVP
jgi:hypothetical protein